MTVMPLRQTIVSRRRLRSKIMPHHSPVVEHTDDQMEGTALAPHRCMIEMLAADKIRGFRGTIGDNGEYLDEVYKSNASLRPQCRVARL